MGASVDDAYIERLHEDIRIAVSLYFVIVKEYQTSEAYSEPVFRLR